MIEAPVHKDKPVGEEITRRFLLSEVKMLVECV